MSRQNTPGLGIEYEVHIPSYFALLLNRHEQVEDFVLRSNVEEFGNLDDLLIDIQQKNGDRLHFAFQLKHKEKHDKNLLPTNFEAKGDFNLEKYCEAFAKLKDENKKYHFILYTNKIFDGKRTKQVETFRMIRDEQCRGEEFFNTTTKGNIYRFEVNEKTEDGKNVTKDDFKRFFQQFTLYTGQINFSDLSKYQIVDILKHKEQYLKYIDLFRRWHRGDFTNKTLDKKTINIHLIDIFLEPFLLKHQITNGRDTLFESAIRKFDLTVINVSKSNFCDNLLKCDKDPSIIDSIQDLLHLAKDIKLIDKSTKELKDDVRLKLLYYFFEKPLIIDFDETSRNLIYETFELYQVLDNRIRFVLVGQQIDIQRFIPRFKTFTKLKDLSEIDKDLYRDVFDKCTLSLQGKSLVTLKQLVDLEEEIDEILRPEEILRMLQPNCLIGEDKEILPKFYIPRTLSLTLISIDKIIKHIMRHRDLVIINFDKRTEEFKDFFLRKNIEMVDIHKYSYLNTNDLLTFPFIITTDDEYQAKQFVAICQTQTSATNIHFLKLVKEEHFTLVMSTGNSFKPTDKPLDRVSIEEDKIHSIFENSINILCAHPGMGKSTLFKSLKNTYLPQMWTVLVDLKAHNDFLKENDDVDDILAHFMESSPDDSLAKKLRRHLIERGKVVIFLDGLDEIESVCVDSLLEFVLVMCSRGFKIWISSRHNMREMIEDKLRIFSIDIDGLTRHQQEEYIRCRLQSIYQRGEVEEILRQISNNADIAKSQQVLGVPLQLYIITEIFQNDRNYIINGNFILTHMYKCFFAGRFNHSLEKTELKHKHMFIGVLEDQLEKYEIPALQALFNEDIFNGLRLDLRRSRKFIETIKTNKDPLGIIVKVSGDRAVFEHFTFAEYFACVFLVNNFETARLLREHIFSSKYQNLCLIFNIMLGGDNPLHLAVIYQDVELIKKHSCEAINVDKGGRNLLHLATNNHRHNMSLELSKEEDRLIIEDSSIVVQLESTGPTKEIVECLLESNCDPLQIDEIFKMSSLEYALAYGFLYAVEAILGKIQIREEILETIRKFWDDSIIAYFALRYGYPKFLSVILSQNYIHPLNQTCSMSLHLRSIIDYILRIDCAKKNEIMNILIDNGVITGKIHYGFRILEFESIEGHMIVIYLLVRKGGKIYTTFEEPFTFTNISSVDEDLNTANAIVITKSTRFTLLTLIDQKMDTNTGPLRDSEGVDIIIRNEGKLILSLMLRDNDTNGLTSLLGQDAGYDQESIEVAALEGDVQVTFNIFKNWF